MASKRKGNRKSDRKGKIQAEPSREVVATKVVEAEVDKSNERSKKALGAGSIVLRAALFALACVFAVLGVGGFIEASNTQNTSRIVTVESVKAESMRHALVLFSADDSDSNVAYERSGMLGVLNSSGVSSDVFYLGKATGSAAKKADQDLYDAIYAKAKDGTSYDAVIVAGDDALQFVSEHRDLFGSIPTTFFAVSDADLAKKMQKDGMATGILEQAGPVLSLENAATLVPSARSAIVLVDGSLRAEGLAEQLDANQNAASAIERTTWDVSEMSRDKLASELKSLGSTSFVMILQADFDSSGTSYATSDTAYFVNANSSVPVFSASDGVGEGVCGAAFFDRETEGSDAALLAIDLVNGKDIASTPVTEVEPMCGVFDVQALEKRGLNPDATPDNAALINESSFSWRVLRPMVRPALFLLAAVVCIVAFGIIGFRRSIKSQRAIIQSRDELQYRLYHDLLTELPNRYALDDFAADKSRGAKMKSMLQLDVNDFSDLNDSYGHAFGDEVIKIIAKRLAGVKSLILARTGGDEFTLAFNHALKPGCSELRHIDRIFADPIIVGDNKIDLSATIGVANREEHMAPEEMIIYSDLAINFAKDNNLHQPVLYAEDMQEGMERKLQITSCLKEAIADQSVVVLWQPQVNTETLEVYGYEALCRLEGNRYFPSDFIPVAEMSGLVNPLDRLVTQKVIAQLGAWLKEGRKPGVASINFSAAQLRDKEYCDFLAEELAKHGVPASLLKIEITESMILGNEDEAERLFSRLRSMGITLALDDFGTGYSSLYRMANRPVDVVKLDKSLVDTFMVPGKEAFIEDITRLVHGLGKTIVVEGVETYEQYQMCQNFKCDIIQGYFFGRPMKPEEVINLDPSATLAAARSTNGDKTRNGNWSKYDRDSHGRWKKKEE